MNVEQRLKFQAKKYPHVYKKPVSDNIKLAKLKLDDIFEEYDCDQLTEVEFTSKIFSLLSEEVKLAEERGFKEGFIHGKKIEQIGEALANKILEGVELQEKLKKK